MYFRTQRLRILHRGQITRVSDSDRLNKVLCLCINVYTVCRYAMNKRVDGQQMGLYTGG